MDFNVRSESIDVEQIMEQIRARIREKRGVDYTEQQIRELAAVKLEKFLDARAVRSDLLTHFRDVQRAPLFAPFPPDPLFAARRPIIARIRARLRSVLRLFFNPDPITDAFTRINTLAAVMITKADEVPQYELLHNLVVELTRTSIEVRNLRVLVDSLASRLDFDERRARALENAVVYRPEPAPSEHAENEGPGQRNRRIRRRHWRAGPPAETIMKSPSSSGEARSPRSVNGAHAGGEAEPKDESSS